jgi:hypothetical protein
MKICAISGVPGEVRTHNILVNSLQTTKYFQEFQVAVRDDNNKTDLRTIRRKVSVSLFIFRRNFSC